MTKNLSGLSVIGTPQTKDGPRPTLLNRLRVLVRNARSEAAGKSLSLISQSSMKEGLAVYCVVRNEAQQLPEFLNHYRKLGFSRFSIVDNDSSDGSLEFLKSQKDVTTYHTKASFKKAGAGCMWRDALIQREGLNRWVCVVDADEYLVFSKKLGSSVQALISVLEQAGQKRLFAPMLDLYRIDCSKKEYFDSSPETARQVRRGCEIWGGVRMRLAKQDNPQSLGPVLSKYPLVFYDRETAYIEPHFPLPHIRNSGQILGRLLHRKMTEWSLQRIDAIIAHNQHWNYSVEYKSYRRWIARELKSETSKIYSGIEDLVDAGLLDEGYIRSADPRKA